MLPGTVVLPCNTVFIIKSISNFNPLTLTADCSATIVIFIKCNVGEAEESVKDYLQKSLRFRFNDVESSAVDDHGGTA